MGKNLKDIVDEGFSQLAGLADKRAEVLLRAERIGNAAAAPQAADAELKMKKVETEFLSEMTERTEQMLQELRQTLAHVSDNSASFQIGIRDNLRLQVTGILSELGRTKSFVLNGTGEKLNAMVVELDKEFQASKRGLGSETQALLADLERWSQLSQASLRHSQTEVAAKISTSEHDISSNLGKAFTQILQGMETKRQETIETLENLYKKQAERVEASNSALNSRIGPLVAEQCDEMKNKFNESEKSLRQTRDTTLDGAISELKEAGKEPLAQLSQQDQSLKHNLNERLAALKQAGADLASEQAKSLNEKNSEAAARASEIYSELSKPETAAAGAGRSPVDDAFADMSLELNGIADDLEGKLKELLGSQNEGLSRLCLSTEKGFSDLSTDFKTQLQDLIKNQEQLCVQEEDELMMQLTNLEKQINDTHTLMKAAGLSPKGDSNGGGSLNK